VADAALALMTILAAKYKQLKSQLRVREIVDTVKSNVGFCRHHLTSCISLTVVVPNQAIRSLRERARVLITFVGMIGLTDVNSKLVVIDSTMT